MERQWFAAAAEELREHLYRAPLGDTRERSNRFLQYADLAGACYSKSFNSGPRVVRRSIEFDSARHIINSGSAVNRNGYSCSLIVKVVSIISKEIISGDFVSALDNGIIIPVN